MPFYCICSSFEQEIDERGDQDGQAVSFYLKFFPLNLSIYVL